VKGNEIKRDIPEGRCGIQDKLKTPKRLGERKPGTRGKDERVNNLGQ